MLDAAGACESDLVTAFADETLHDAIARLLRRGVGRLPVAARANPKQIVGYLGRTDILAVRHRYHDEEEVRERGFQPGPAGAGQPVSA